MNDALIFDREAVNERFDNDMSFFKEVYDLFFEQYQQKLNLLHELVKSEDRDNLKIEAHSMKGALANLGAMRASIASKNLEHNSKTAQAAELSQMLDNLSKAVAEFKALPLPT